MLADQSLGRRVHRLGVEAGRHVPDPAGIEHRRRPTIEDPVEVVALHRREAGVEVVRHRLGREHRDRRRAEMGVDGVAHRVGGPVAAEVEMGDLAEGVDAGVGAPGALDHHRLAGEGADRLFEGLLHRRAIGLALPADERAAVILDGQLVAWHRRLSRGPAASGARRRGRPRS